MGDIIYLNDYKKKHDIPLTHSPYYALNATRNQMRDAYKKAAEWMNKPLDGNGTLPYAVLIGYENIKTGKVKLLKEMRVFSAKEIFEHSVGIGGHYVIALTRKAE